MCENGTSEIITIWLEDEAEESGFVTFPGVYVGNNLAIAVVNQGLEILLVEPVPMSTTLYDLRMSTEPLFCIEGHSVDAVLMTCQHSHFPSCFANTFSKDSSAYKIGSKIKQERN